MASPGWLRIPEPRISKVVPALGTRLACDDLRGRPGAKPSAASASSRSGSIAIAVTGGYRGRGARELRASFPARTTRDLDVHGVEAVNAHRYHKRIRLKYWFLSFFYDFVEVFFRFNTDTNPRHGLARLVPNDDLRILDVCFGTGNNTLLIAKNNDRNMITGLDLSADMLEVANRKIRKRGLSNVETIRMDAADMDLEEESFDVATSAFGLHEMEYPVMKLILKNMNRVLKKGGKLYLVDYQIQDTALKRFFFRVYLLLTSPPHVKDFLKYDWEAIMGECGFRIDRIEPYKISQIICATRSH
jgi:demethylmenaquinone methyltransferase/2-methoxy-6-polyprenyl-1,4-benzoquinol methylase